MSIACFWKRGRLGGRIRTTDEAGRPSDDGFDLGASWIWPAAQPAVAALVEEPGLAPIPQYDEGDVVFHRMSREAPQRFLRAGDPPADPSMRVVGGTGALVSALPVLCVDERPQIQGVERAAPVLPMRLWQSGRVTDACKHPRHHRPVRAPRREGGNRDRRLQGMQPRSRVPRLP